MAWAEALTRLSGRIVPDEIYDMAMEQFSEEEIIDITLAVIAINSYNRINLAFPNVGVVGTYKPGVHAVATSMKMLNTRQYLAMRREAYQNDGVPVPTITTSPADKRYDINGTWDTTRYTDWEKFMIGNTARFTNAQASISGGTINIISGSAQRFLANSFTEIQTSLLPTLPARLLWLLMLRQYSMRMATSTGQKVLGQILWPRQI